MSLAVVNNSCVNNFIVTRIFMQLKSISELQCAVKAKLGITINKESFKIKPLEFLAKAYDPSKRAKTFHNS